MKIGDDIIGHPHGELSFDGVRHKNPDGDSLAHSNYRSLLLGKKAEIHFDNYHKWVYHKISRYNFRSGRTFKNKATHIDLVTTAIHEIGHLLGLLHSKNKSDVMYRKHAQTEPNTEYSLGDGDIKEIQNLYGKFSWK